MAEIYVTSTADSGAGSLRQAIADASDGDVILFDSDVFPAGQTTAILLSAQIVPSHNVGIYGGESDGNGGYTSGTEKRFYVYREIEGVKTKVVITSPDDAQEGETVLFTNVCRVALDGQGANRCVYNAAANINWLGVCFANGYSGNYGGAVNNYNATVNTFNDCTIMDCSATYGGGVYSRDTSQNTLNDCNITDCSATYGGGVYSASASQNTLTDCTFDGCSATSNGGGVFSSSTSQNTLNDCTISGCSATYGGGVYSRDTSQNTLNDCVFDGCTATASGGALRLEAASINSLNSCVIKNCSATTNCGGIYAGDTTQNTFNNCNINNCTSTQNIGGVALYNTNGTNVVNNCVMTGNIGSDASRNDFIIAVAKTTIVNNSQFGSLRLAYNATPTFNEGITTAASFILASSGGVYPTLTIADGAALTLTGTATIGAATFTSEGRGYLAVGAGIDTSAATLTNVVLCAYGADVSSFAEVDGVLEWEAANPTTTVLIERADGDSWSTVAQPTGESLTLYLPPSDTVRLFDGVQFFTAQAPSQRTYYYIGGSEGSFTSAADWSLRRGGAAITEPPVVAGQKFIVGDISSGE